MAQKWNLQDIRPAGTERPITREVPQKRAQQDIAPRRRVIEKQEEFIDPDLAMLDVVDGNSLKRKRVLTTVVVSLIIVSIGFFVNVLLGGADITVYPKIKDISVQATFTTYKEPKVDDLGYELLTLETTGEKQVKASSKENVSLHAEGKIFVYNTKSTSPQRLIKNTRFESKDGLVYRIKESIEVPGAKKDEKGNLVPGSVVADVSSDGTGEQYNIAPGRFTVPGLKGSEQYDNVYGESTAGFTGGFEGEKYIIDEQELNTAKQALHIELRDSLLKRLNAERPAGFVIYDGAITFTYESLPSTEYGDSLATIKEKTKLLVPMFKESELAMYLADKSIPDYKGEPVTLLNPQALTFTYTGATTTLADISTMSALEFTLKGASKVVWQFDQEKLQKELVGIKKTAATTIFSSYGSISHAQAEVRPFWKTTFPTNPKEINVRTVLDGVQ